MFQKFVVLKILVFLEKSLKFALPLPYEPCFIKPVYMLMSSGPLGYQAGIGMSTCDLHVWLDVFLS